jgi:2,4-dienoyl-CoA reductase-like NADH-dependent reductase (Old Yellow Enzyme family)
MPDNKSIRITSLFERSKVYNLILSSRPSHWIPMSHKKHLFTPLQIKSIEFKNRIWLSPMCQYSSNNGFPSDWHFVHLGSRAMGGAGMVMIEATAVSPEGRISPQDNGIWSDEHIAHYQRLSDFVKATGAISGIQLAHAGRKASVASPWLGGQFLSAADGGWQTIAPSALAFIAGNPAPHAMTEDDIANVTQDFEKAAERCLAAGFQVLELHMAHGYLLHEFLSPLSNTRNDQYGGPLENRMRFPLAIARAVRKIWPQNLPLFARISCTDWLDGPDELKPQNKDTNKAWNLASSIIFCHELKELGIDLIDCSSGGTLANAIIPVGPGYQVPFAQAIRQQANIMTTAVGMITEATQAESILVQQQADAVFMGREFLRNPYWPVHAAQSLGVKFERPNQYARAH